MIIYINIKHFPNCKNESTGQKKESPFPSSRRTETRCFFCCCTIKCERMHKHPAILFQTGGSLKKSTLSIWFKKLKYPMSKRELVCSTLPVALKKTVCYFYCT